MASLRVWMLLLGAALLELGQLCEGAPLPGEAQSAGDFPDEQNFPLNLLLVVSVSVLVATVVVLFNCVTCCKEREINFKEFEDNFEDEIDFTPPAEDTPSMQSPAEVYTLAVPQVPMPGPPHLQLPRITDASTGPHVARHTLSYIQEIGSGWFGKVLLSEIYSDPSITRVVVKELKANASSKEQNDFLQQGDPYRVLRHPNILHCLGQCVEAIPFLLVFEYTDLPKRTSLGWCELQSPVSRAHLEHLPSGETRQLLGPKSSRAKAGGWHPASLCVPQGQHELIEAQCCIMCSAFSVELLVPELPI
ncbi:serine/threonine-protein kinase LMTK2 isoform X1 [Tachysurus ichikawai]